MVLGLIVLMGAVLRFYNLMWGNGHFFHPDENNMASSISQMTPEKMFHPNFFAYGQFPLYLSYFLSQALYVLTGLTSASENTEPFVWSPVSHKDAVFGLRLIAASSSTLTIIVTYFLTKLILTDKSQQDNKKLPYRHSIWQSANFYPLITAFLVACAPAFIQSAHFGTTESLLTFFFVLVVYGALRTLTANRLSMPALVLGITTGLALGTKITAATFLLPSYIALTLSPLNHIQQRFKKAALKVLLIALLTTTAAIFFLLSSPYTLIDFKRFQETSTYETNVATGETQVFYTRQFIDTIPFLFQIQHVFPFTLGSALFILSMAGLAAFPLVIITCHDKVRRKQYAVLLISVLVFFIANSVLFVKWTRFLSPALPFLVMFGVLILAVFEGKLQDKARIYTRFAGGVVAALTAIAGIAFFSIYTRDDVRHTASEWIYRTIPKGSYILSETGNVVDIPLHLHDKETEEYKNVSTYDYTVVSFDFYGLDERSDFKEKLLDDIERADYIFVPSRRIFSNHMRLPEKYPWVANYYKTLFNGELGFEEIKTISSYPSLFGLEFPDEHAEETWTVFDHPVVRIYQKTENYPREYYQQRLSPQN